MNPPNVPPIEIQTKTPDPDCKEDRRDCVQELSDWADQYRSELEKQCSAHAAQKENLGRTQEEQHLIDSSMQWMLAKRDEVQVKGFFEN